MDIERILESKVSKCRNGFYGRFDKMGLFVFSRENLADGLRADSRLERYRVTQEQRQAFYRKFSLPAPSSKWYLFFLFF